MRITFCGVTPNRDYNTSGSTLGSPYCWGRYLIKQRLGRRKKPQIQRPGFYICLGFRTLPGTLPVVDGYPPITENQMDKKNEHHMETEDLIYRGLWVLYALLAAVT